MDTTALKVTMQKASSYIMYIFVVEIEAPIIYEHNFMHSHI
jgi:hypothetical protein